MSVLIARLIVVLGLVGPSPGPRQPVLVRVPLVDSVEIDVAEVVSRLAQATGVVVDRPSGPLRLPVSGPTGNLTRRMLAESLGTGVSLTVEPGALVLTLSPERLRADVRADWERRLGQLAGHTEREVRRRARYGMRALDSYRPNDPSRPTVCLVHGVNSSSGGFVHMIPPLEEAGFGVVVYDYPFNRSLEESCAAFARDWRAFRERVREQRPWAILGHSMGALVARAYVEDPEAYGGDVSSLILIAPVNQGSRLAKAQTLLQIIHSVQAVNGKKTSEALAHLGDGLGEAAEDMSPGSAFLKGLNARPRRAGVAYHILAGDAGFLPQPTRRRIEEQLGAVRRNGGLLGGLSRLAVPNLSERLDEFTDGTGDGCVAVARTRLDGVADHVTIHANHAELIRAPLLFADPGPVVCMPYVLRWLGTPAGGQPATAPRP